MGAEAEPEAFCMKLTFLWKLQNTPWSWDLGVAQAPMEVIRPLLPSSQLVAAMGDA